MSVDRYRLLVAELAQLDDAHRSWSESEHRRHADAAASAADRVEAAEAALRSARAAARHAADRVEATDARAERLWEETAALLGRRGRRLGPVPGADVGRAGPGRIDAELDAAAAAIGRAATGEPVAAVPPWLGRLAPAIGAASTTAVLLALRLLDAAAGSTVTVTVLTGLMTFLAPFAGLAPVAWWTRRDYGRLPPAGTLGLMALGGMAASCALALLAR